METDFISFNRDLPEIAPGAPIWAHLTPLGDFPGALRNRAGAAAQRVTQRCDREALETIVRNFRPKLLVDFEHRSELPNGDTVAAAWILDLEIRPDGLWGRLELSDLGEQAVKNKRYRHLSPAFEIAPVPGARNVFRPVRLMSVGLTNKHNLKALQPLTNSAAAASIRKDPAMQQIATALGLPEASEEPAILNAISALKTARQTDKTALDQATAKIQALESAALNTEAEAFLEKHAARIKNKETVRKQFVANKEATIALFDSLATIEGGARIHNRADSRTPNGDANPPDKAQAQKTLVLMVRNREKCDHKTAWNIARAEKPELFIEEEKQA